MDQPSEESAGPSGRTPALRRNVSINLQKPGTVFLIAFVIFLGALGLRLVGLGEYPKRHATNDEFHYIWGGLNFWHHGTTASWSQLQGQANLNIGEAYFDGDRYDIISPTFDHPPLFTLLTGAFAHLADPQEISSPGKDGHTVTIWDVNLARARLMMVGLFVITYWLLFDLVCIGIGPAVALLTVLFYGFMSHAVAHGRLIVPDNLLALLLVAAAWVFQRWQAGRSTTGRMGWAMAVLMLLCTLTKIPGWCMLPAMMAAFFVAGRPKETRYLFYGFGAGLVLYVGWLAYYGLSDFVAAIQTQSGRFRGFNAFQLWSGLPRLMAEFDLNGVVIAGWFCLLAQALQPGARAIMAIAPAYTLAFTFFAGDMLFGWYSAPMYPWLAVALGLTTWQVYKDPRSPMMVAWLLLFLPHAFQTLYIARYDLETVLRFAFVGCTAVLIGALALPAIRGAKVLRVAMIAVLAVVFMREVYEVTNQRTDRLTDAEKYVR